MGCVPPCMPDDEAKDSDDSETIVLMKRAPIKYTKAKWP